MKTLILSLLIVLPAFAKVTLTEEQVAGHTAYRIENYRVNLLIDPQRGGAITAYRDKLGDNVEFIIQKPYNALCMDHFQAQGWPGEMLDTPYAGKLIKQTDDECVVQVSYTVQGVWGGITSTDLEGLQLVKTYTVRADSPALRCDVVLTAPTTKSKLPAYWQQNILYPGGAYEGDRDLSYRPSTRGVRVKSATRTGMTGPEDFLRDPTAGWIGLIDQQTKTGVAVLMDYNQVRYLYCNNGSQTVEPMFHITYLPPGGSVTYTTHIVPVAGLANVVTATEDYIAGYALHTDGAGQGDLSVAVVRSVRAPKSLKLNLQIRSVVDQRPPVAVGPLAFTDLSDKPVTQTATFTGVGADPLVITGTSADRHSFEEYFNGRYNWGENLTTDMVTPVYVGPRPAQKLTLQKPANLGLRNGGAANFWYVEGLGTDAYRISDAFRLTADYNDTGFVLKRVFVKTSMFGTELNAFPYDYEELLSYNTLVLDALRPEALGAVGLAMLQDYVNVGGGLVMLGSATSYGRSGFPGTPVEEWLPVKIKPGATHLLDVQSAPIEVADARNPILRDLDFSKLPQVRYVHDVEVKPGAQVLLTVAGHPLLVAHEYGPGRARVVCWLAPAIGTVKQPFWQWSDWPYLMRQVFWWTTHQDYHLQEYNR